MHAGRAKGGAFRFQQEEQASKPQLARSALPPAAVFTPLKQPQVAQAEAPQQACRTRAAAAGSSTPQQQPVQHTQLVLCAPSPGAPKSQPAPAAVLPGSVPSSGGRGGRCGAVIGFVGTLPGNGSRAAVPAAAFKSQTGDDFVDGQAEDKQPSGQQIKVRHRHCYARGDAGCYGHCDYVHCYRYGA